MKKILALTAVLILSLNLSTCAQFYPETEPDCINALREAALSGNIQSGRSAARARAELIDEGKLEEEKFSFDELFLLSKFIYTQTRRRSLSEEYLQCSAELILNRVASPEFPDTMEEVLAAEPAYAETQTPYFKASLLPDKKSVNTALRILSGKRMLPPSVVYQSSDNSGDVYASFCDRVLGFTYFCRSENPEFYMEQPREEEVFELSCPSDTPGVSVNPGQFSALKNSCIIVHADLRDKHA